MNVKELLKKENKKFEDFYLMTAGWYNFEYENLTSLEGLPEDFNDSLDVSRNNIRTLKGLPEKFNKLILLYDNKIENLEGLNNILNPNNIRGVNKDLIVSEYKRLGKHHLLI